MSAKFMRKETALACPVHMKIKKLAEEGLMDVGYFEKAEILKDSNLIAMADSIRWDYIREFIEIGETGHDCELIPLSQRFFVWRRTAAEIKEDLIPSNRKKAMEIVPDKFLAGGNGKRTAGYLLAGETSCPNITIRKMERRQNHNSGTEDKWKGYQRNVTDAITSKGGTVPIGLMPSEDI